MLYGSVCAMLCSPTAAHVLAAFSGGLTDSLTLTKPRYLLTWNGAFTLPKASHRGLYVTALSTLPYLHCSLHFCYCCTIPVTNLSYLDEINCIEEDPIMVKLTKLYKVTGENMIV